MKYFWSKISWPWPWNKTIRGKIRQFIQGHIRPYKANTAIQYHHVSQKIKPCPHCFFINFILTQRNIFCSLCTFFCSSAHFLFPCTFFVSLHTFCSIWNIFHSCFHANNKNNNNNKASFRTFEHCSRSKTYTINAMRF